nr:hypothetical protein GCM10020063_094150 [Dactylosporangium thailandense]
MNDLDPRLTTALHARADGEVHIESLLTASVRHGVRHRRNRRLLIGGAAAATVAAILATTALLPRATQPPAPAGTPPRPSASASPAVVLPRPPVAGSGRSLSAGAPVGDAFQIHLDVTDPDVLHLSYSSAAGLESLRVTRGSTSPNGYDTYRLTLGDSPDLWTGDGAVAPLPEAGRKGEMKTGDGWAALRWQPIDGIWATARLEFRREDPKPAPNARGGLLEIARWVRLDRVLRCAADFRLGWAPENARTVGCGLDWSGRTGFVGFAFGTADDGSPFYLTEIAPGDVHPNASYGGVPFQSGRDGSTIEVGGRAFSIEAGTSGVPKDVLQHMLTSIQPSPGTVDPLTW